MPADSCGKGTKPEPLGDFPIRRRVSKVTSLGEAAEQIEDGSTVAVGGLSTFGAPMALVRALVRRRARNLTLVTAAVTSLQADLLIAAGCVRKIISPYMTLGDSAFAPAFRRAVEKGEIELVEIGEAFLGFGLKAAASGSPYAALPLPLAASDCARVNPLYRLSSDPFTGKQVLCVPALRLDWTLLHTQYADANGNLQYASACFMDPLLARAADRVIATVDELAAKTAPQIVPTIPGFLVHGVVPLFGAARPTASFGCYDVDQDDLRRYTEDVSGYVQRLTSTSEEDEYREGRLVVPHSSGDIDLDRPPSKSEIIATVISRNVRDGMFTGVGTGCWEVAAGLRLAQLTHAPNLTFTLGGSGAVNSEISYLPVSLNSDEPLLACEGSIRLEDVLDFELRGRFDVMFASGIQVDAYGNLNLTSVGPYERPKFRGPGTVGLEFAPCAGEVVIFLRQHSPRTFVEKVDFISGIGYGTGPASRIRWGIEDRRGPKLVVTNLAVMDFDANTQRMRLQSVHPGVTVEDVRKNTGFELVISDGVTETPPPSEEELTLLRTRIDRTGMLARLAP